jgi:Type II secretion system (T2SS), protein K
VAKHSSNGEQNGFILIIVIWLMAFFSLVVTGVTRSVHAHVRQTAHQVQSRNMELLADAGVTLATLDLFKGQGRTGRPRRFPIDGTPVQCQLDDAFLTISVHDTGGRVSLNTGGERLLQALFLGLGASTETARRATDVIIDFRDSDDLRRPEGAEKPEYKTAGRVLGPKNEPFDALEELHQVLGLAPQIISAVRPYVTVHSGTAGLDPRVTTPGLAELLAKGAAKLPNAPLPTTLNTSGSVLPGEFVIGSPQRNFSIVVQAQAMRTTTAAGIVPVGVTYVRDANVELLQGRESLPNIKGWKRGTGMMPSVSGSEVLPHC